MLILEILHTAFYYLFWMKLRGFGLDGFYKLNSIGKMIFWTIFSFLSFQSLICWFLATAPQMFLGFATANEGGQKIHM